MLQVIARLRQILGWLWRLAVRARGLLLALVAAVASVAALLVLVGPVAWRVGGRTVTDLAGKDRADAINSVRQILLAGAAGLIALGGLGFTARNYYLSRRGQVTDRYTKAIALLASEKDAERIGGIYALEHILLESPRDHPTVIDVLAAFVRQHAPATPAKPPSDHHQDEGHDDEPSDYRPEHRDDRRPSADVQAALTVLARRPDRPELNRLDLRRADLAGAELAYARLTRARLATADLQGADLNGAQLQGADLVGAQLQGAHLVGAQLQRADLNGAQLQGAHLVGAQLQGAHLNGAQLQGAHLGGAQLQGADLNEAQLQGANLFLAELQGAHLGGAQLQDVDLGGAQLKDADLRGTLGLIKPQLLAGVWESSSPPKLDGEREAWLASRNETPAEPTDDGPGS
jgi:uncharacterized protein YjbI with pentapeptide repeats